MNETKTVAGAYAANAATAAEIKTHEAVCAERYQNIRDDFADVKGWMKMGVAALLAMAMTLFGFMAHELYDNAVHPSQVTAQAVAR